jgi:hypothetical protein
MLWLCRVFGQLSAYRVLQTLLRQSRQIFGGRPSPGSVKMDKSMLVDFQ